MTNRLLVPLLAILLLAASYRPAPALAQPAPTPTPPAEVILVNSTADPGDGVCDDSECTLREAIAAAEEGATIEFSLPEASTITLVDGQLVITQSLTIDGSTAPGLTVSGNDSSRVFSTKDGTIKLKSFTIADGHVANPYSRGGGIENWAVLMLESVTIRNNFSEGGGGGVANAGYKILIVNSTISQNQTAGSGGGIYNTLRISPNREDWARNQVHLHSSTITENRAVNKGGGIFDEENDIGCNRGGCLYGNSDLFAASTVIFGNKAPAYVDCWGFDGGGGYNLLGRSCDASSTDISLPASVASQILGSLADNGGPTATHALLPGSLARDAGNPAGCTYDNDGNPNTPDTIIDVDQRGLSRPMEGDGDSNARCDIGAYEAQIYTPAPPITIPPPLIHVNSTADSGDGLCDAEECTLREAIIAAEMDDTILFDLPPDSTIRSRRRIVHQQETNPRWRLIAWTHHQREPYPSGVSHW